MVNIAGKGHGVIATQDLAPGSVLYTEEALIVGPGSGEACVECLSLENGCEESCPKCGHRICKKCSVISELRWHTQQECDYMSGLNQDPATVFNFIFPLRLALFRQNKREEYDTKVAVLESHLEGRLAQVGAVQIWEIHISDLPVGW